MPEYEVTVGNIGTVYKGPDAREARETFDEYLKQSKEGYGRAAGEPVALFDGPVVLMEHHGILEQWRRAAGNALMAMEALPELEPTSAFKQAGSDEGIPYGDEMEAFVTWALREVDQ